MIRIRGDYSRNKANSTENGSESEVKPGSNVLRSVLIELAIGVVAGEILKKQPERALRVFCGTKLYAGHDIEARAPVIFLKSLQARGHQRSSQPQPGLGADDVEARCQHTVIKTRRLAVV